MYQTFPFFIFKVISPIDQGGFAAIYKIEILASDVKGVRPGQRYAAKFLLHNNIQSVTNRARFRREIEILSRLDHPSIMPLIGLGAHGGELCYIMTLYEATLRENLDNYWATLPWHFVAKFIVKIADAMAYAHRQNIFHRDLKPENILLSSDDLPIIGDWGLGGILHDNYSNSGLTVGGLGTPIYSAPEQLHGQDSGAKSDIYSLGVLTAEMLGYCPNQLLLPGRLNRPLVQERSPEADEFNNLIWRMLARNPDDRPVSMEVVADELCRLLSRRESRESTARVHRLKKTALYQSATGRGYKLSPRAFDRVDLYRTPLASHRPILARRVGFASA